MRSEWLEEARSAWEGEGSYRIAWSDGREDWTCDGPVWFGSAEELAEELGAAYGYATDAHLPYAERVPARRAIFVEANRTGYHPNQCHTMTLGELVGYLEELSDAYGEECEVYLRHDGGYTYGGLSWGDVQVGKYDEDRVVLGEEE